MKILAVSDEDTNMMFQLMGIQTYTMKSTDSNAFSKEFDKILQDTSIGIIFLNEKYLVRNKAYFLKVKKRKLPIVVEIPDDTGPLNEKYFEDFVQGYIGLGFSKNSDK